MEQKNEKQLIFFKDLLFTALYRWKSVLIVGIVFALLLGGFAVLNNNEAVTMSGSSMTPETKHRVEQLEMNRDLLEKQIESHEIYLKESPLMVLDPYNCAKVGFYIYVAPVEPSAANEHFEGADAALRAYRSFLLSSKTMDALSSQIGIAPQHIPQLITFDTTYENCLGITIWGNTLEETTQQAKVMEALISAYSEQDAQELMPHDVTLIPFSAGPTIDFALFDAQKSATQKLTTMKNELTSVKTDLNRYAPTQLTAGASNPILFAIIGGVLGVFIVVCVAWLIHICGGKIYSGRVLSNRTGIWVLGSVQGQKKRNCIDRWLRKLEGRAQHTAPDTVAVNIRNLCKDAKKLLVMGNFAADTMTGLTEKLASAGIECVICPDPSVKADALENLPACDAVVLVETCGASTYDNVEWAMKTVGDHEKPLLGCILIDG